ncbi:MAG: glycosyltransferase [Candidatus Methylomirabilales bacterium]
MGTRLRVIVLGIMGRAPFAGVAWQALHYLEGFRRLDHDVYYVEDTGEWPYDAERNTITDDCTYTVDYLGRLMTWCGLPDRWAYRAAGADGRTFGLSESAFSKLFQEAELLVNVTGATVLRDEHLRVPMRVYLETDPGLAQIEVVQRRQFTLDLLDAHTHHFTFGENYGLPQCRLPVGPFKYRPTRQPIVLEWWGDAPARGCREARHAGRFTTISSWQQSGKDIEWNGETYLWSKHLEFLKFIDLPRHTAQPLELALACEDEQVIGLLRSRGWSVVNAIALSKDVRPYRDYIREAQGEFTVAKDQYVRLRTGWFSDRSACYLAAGRPVVTQDTGFGRVLPTGEGLFAFRTSDDVLAAFEAIQADYARHSRAARALAEEYFRAETVLARLLGELGG